LQDYSKFKMAVQTESSYISGHIVDRDKKKYVFRNVETNEIDNDRLQVRFLCEIKMTATKPQVVMFLAL